MFGWRVVTYRATDGTRWALGASVEGSPRLNTFIASAVAAGRGAAIFHVEKGGSWAFDGRSDKR